MKIEILKSDRIIDFIKYCKKYREEIDSTFLYDEDLNEFSVDDDNPTYIITNDDGEIKATVSLVIDDYQRKGNKARFRIIHSELEDIKYYQMMFDAVLPHTTGLNKVYLFIPLNNKKLINYIEELNFNIERYSFILIRDNEEVPDFELGDGYHLKTFEPGVDDEIWVDIRNVAFKKLLGNETPITTDMMSQMYNSSDYIKGGLKILYKGDEPIGIVRVTDDSEDGETIINIGPIALLPEYQGKGLGTILLRSALKFGKEKSFEKSILCVNAENEKAKSLYIKEGFEELEEVVCYKYDL